MQRHTKSDIADIKTRMEKRLETISQEYDFANFSFSSFRAWIEGYRGKPLRLVPDKLVPQFFGAWMEAQEDDYIFFKLNTIPLHQNHILLHEMAHMLCGHPTLMLSDDVISAYQSGDMQINSLLLRSTRTDEMEWEAEILAALIQEKIFAYERVQELTRTVLMNDEEGKIYIATGLLD